MTGGEKKLCLILAEDNLFAGIRETAAPQFIVENVSGIQKAVSIIRQRRVLCIIAGVDSAPETSPQHLSLFIDQFPTIPVIAVVDGSNFEQIFSCGKMQMTEIVLDTELEKLQEKLFLVLNRRQLRGGQIDVSNCSPLVKKAVELIEEQYCQLKSAQSVSDILGVNLSTLSREFSKQCKANLLNFIYFLKFREAVCLIKNPGFRLKDIAERTGFISIVQLDRWFNKFVEMPPKEVREKKLVINFKSVFDKKVRIKD